MYLLSLAGWLGSGSVTALSLVCLLAAAGISSGMQLGDVSIVDTEGSDLLVDRAL